MKASISSALLSPSGHDEQPFKRMRGAFPVSQAGSHPCGAEARRSGFARDPNREYFVCRLSMRRAGRYDAATSSYTAKVRAITTRSLNFANAFALAA